MPITWSGPFYFGLWHRVEILMRMPWTWKFKFATECTNYSAWDIIRWS